MPYAAAQDDSVPSADPLCTPAGEPREREDIENTGIPAWQVYGEKADLFHRIVCERLVSSANWLDSFFRDERSEIEENTSYMRLRLSTFFEKGEGPKSDARLRLRLVLPELQDKLYIMVSGEQDKDKNIAEDPLIDKTSEIDEDSERNFNLSLRYFVRKARDMNFSLKIGARVNSFSPIFYAGPRYRRTKHIGSWLIRFTQEVQYFSGDGWECCTRFDFDRLFKKDMFFRTRTEGCWFEEEYGYFYEIRFSIFQKVDEDRALQYSWSNYFETRPEHCLDQTLLNITYRQRFWRKWLFFEIGPQLAFRQENDYRPFPGITFSVEMYFGNKN